MKTARFLVLGLVLISFELSQAQSEQKKLISEESSPPNIIFMMSDDHGYQAISAYGYGLNETPNIDRLADEGIMFTRSTVTNSLCAPSRAVILTGKHSHINGKIDIARSSYDWDQNNFMKILKENGYETAIIGKVHL